MVASVREILELGEAGRITSNEIFTPGPDGRGRPNIPPRCLPDLIAAGFDPQPAQPDRRLLGHQPATTDRRVGRLAMGGLTTARRRPAAHSPALASC